MKSCMMAAIISTCSVLVLTGCGGGGGGSGTAPVAKAVTKVCLFGTMSANSRIATVQTTMTVPSGVLVNYSSPPGASTGTFPLRGDFIVPSGPVLVAATGISGTYDIASRKLTVSMINMPGSNQVSLMADNAGDGVEIATIIFPLAAPGVTTPLPTTDLLVTVGQERPSSLNYLTGCRINFVTAYQ